MQIAHLDLLENAQFTPEQARALLQVMDNSAKEQGHSTATKGDLLQAESKLELKIESVRKEIQQVKGELKADILEVKSDLGVKIEQVRSEIQEVKGELTTAVERSANRLIMWIVPLTIGSAGIVAFITRLMLHP